MKRILFCAAVLVLAIPAWAKTYHLSPSSSNPAAAGDVDVSTNKNGNVQVGIKTTHVAKADLLTPPATAYVVWFEQEGSEPQNEGVLKIGDNLKGELKTTTPFHKFDVLITIENDPMTKAPSDRILFQTRVQE